MPKYPSGDWQLLSRSRFRYVFEDSMLKAEAKASDHKGYILVPKVVLLRFIGRDTRHKIFKQV